MKEKEGYKTNARQKMMIWPETDGARNGDEFQTPERIVGEDVDAS